MPDGRPWDYLPDYDPSKDTKSRPSKAPAGAKGAGLAKQFSDITKDVAWQGLQGFSEGAMKAPGMLLGDLPLAIGSGVNYALDGLQSTSSSYNPVGLALSAFNPSGAPRSQPTAETYENYPLGSAAQRRFLRDYAGFEDPVPAKTALGRYVGAGAEMIPAAVATGGRSLLASAGRGFLGGVGAEGMGDLFPNSPMMRVIGGLLGAYSPELARGSVNAMIPNMTKRAADDAEELMRLGIPVAPGEAASNPLINSLYGGAKQTSLLPSSFTGRQDAAINRTLSRAIGENSDDLGEAVASARTRLGQTYDDLRSRTTAALDSKAVRALKSLERRAARDITDPSQLKLVQNKIAEVRAAAAKGKGYIKGAQYKNLVGEKSSLSVLTNNRDPYLKTVGGDLVKIVDDMFERSMSTADAAAMKAANRQYRNMKLYEQPLANQSAAAIDQKLPARMASFTQGRSAYGDAGMPEAAAVARGAQSVLKSIPDSGTPRRVVAGGILTGMGGAIAGASPVGVGAVAGAAALPMAAERALESQRLMRAMIAKQRAMAAASGARGPRFAPGAVSPALLGINAGLKGGQHLTPVLPGPGLLAYPLQ